MLLSAFRPVFDTISTRNPPALTDAAMRLPAPSRPASGAALLTSGAGFSTAPAHQSDMEADVETEAAAEVTPEVAAGPVVAADLLALAPKPREGIASNSAPAPRPNTRPIARLNSSRSPRPNRSLKSALAAAFTSAWALIPPAASLLPAASAAAETLATVATTAPAGARSPSRAPASPVLSDSELDALLSRCAPTVAPATMRAIVKTESSGNPFAIGVVGGRLTRQPRSLAEALSTVRSLEARGLAYSAGLAQIYRKNFTSLGLTPERTFSPCENLKAAARVLSRCYEGTAGTEALRLSAAFSCYYSGDPVRGRNLGYSARVAKNAGVTHPAFLPGGGQTPPWRPRAPPGAAPGSTQNAPAGLRPAL